VDSNDGGGTPIGAIVGGAVGGAAVVGLLVFLFCFYIIRPLRSDAKRLVNKNQGVGGDGQQQQQGMAQTLDPNNPQNHQFLPVVPGVVGAGDVEPLGQQQQQAVYGHGGGFNNTNMLYPQQHEQGGMYPSSPPENTGVTPPQNNHFQQHGMYTHTQPLTVPQQQAYPFPLSQQQQQQHPRPPGPPAGTTELPVHYPLGTEGHRAELKGS